MKDSAGTRSLRTRRWPEDFCGLRVARSLTGRREEFRGSTSTDTPLSFGSKPLREDGAPTMKRRRPFEQMKLGRAAFDPANGGASALCSGSAMDLAPRGIQE